MHHLGIFIFVFLTGNQGNSSKTTKGNLITILLDIIIIITTLYIIRILYTIKTLHNIMVYNMLCINSHIHIILWMLLNNY